MPVAAPLKTGVNITPITRNEKASPVTLQLAKDGKALLPIVISAKASDNTRFAAGELKKYLGQMSGATFEIKVGDGTSGIVLGTKSEFPVPALDKALEIVHSFDGKESYAIRTRANKLLLLAATDKGISHVAHRLLEELGCRWFFPNTSDQWEVVPKIPDLKFAREITDRPAFLARDIWYAWGYIPDSDHPYNTPEKKRSGWGDFYDWQRRNAMGGSFGVNAGHAYEAIARLNAAEFEKHPEYWALVGGKRSGPQFDLGNPNLRKLVVDYAVKLLQGKPRRRHGLG